MQAVERSREEDIKASQKPIAQNTGFDTVRRHVATQTSEDRVVDRSAEEQSRKKQRQF